MTDRSSRLPQATAEFLAISRRHFGLGTAARLGSLLLASSLGALAGTALADNDHENRAPRTRLEQPAAKSDSSAHTRACSQ
jgi:hypothetical protein